MRIRHVHLRVEYSKSAVVLTGAFGRDVRAAVDLCHRDGSLKQTVAADPGRYMHEDPRLAPMLESLRVSGRKVFLATNSLWDYTHVVMNFLLCGAPDTRFHGQKGVRALHWHKRPYVYAYCASDSVCFLWRRHRARLASSSR